MKRSFFKNYGFFLMMLTGMVLGCILGAIFPAVRDEDGTILSAGATVLEPLGTVFLNLMFCVVVPMVFCSIASAIASMDSARTAGKIMGITISTFFVTATIAALLMFAAVQLFPPVQEQYEITEGTVDTAVPLGQLVVNFFTKPDFYELLSRKAILPLIVFAVLCGFGIQLSGGKDSMAAKLLQDITACLFKTVHLITYYAPIGFLGFFASLVAGYGTKVIADYARALGLYYILSFLYMLLVFPLYARFGGGKTGVKTMFRHLFRPAMVAFGTCSSVATLPTNMEAARRTGISAPVADIVLPLGATMHMDGSAMSAIVKVAFLFGIFGQDFTSAQGILAVVVAVLSSVAMSGIPGGGSTGELVLCTIFFPEQLAVAFPIAIALGNLVDPPATMVNAAGDYVACFITERFVTGKNWLARKGKE